jgi:two-component system phosphate regulon sensor histidine kinase PhoR
LGDEAALIVAALQAGGKLDESLARGDLDGGEISPPEAPLEVRLLTPAAAQDSLDREIREAIVSGYGRSARASESGTMRLHVALRIGSPETPQGIIAVSRPRPAGATGAILTDLRAWVATTTMLGLGLWLTHRVVSRMISPLESLTVAARQIAAGETPETTPTQIRNEIGTLAKAFESMNRQLTGRISDLQSQRLKLQHNNEQLETVLGAMVEGVIAVDEQERIILANSAALRLLELTPTAMVDRPIWEALRQPRIDELIRRALKGESTERIELQLPRVQTTISAAVSRLPGEPCPGAVLVLHDVTELRRLEQLRTEFVANVSHELKTPLSSIAAYTETLLDGAMDDPEHNREFLERIEEQTERLQTLIVELLSLARMETQDPSAELEPVDALAIIGDSVDAHQALADSKRVRLELQSELHPVIVLANAEGIQTIIDNLLDNAINYTSSGGAVTVRCIPEGEWLRIDVADTGIGIAVENQSRVFERFFRVDKARSRELGGTGLGLSIVKHFCQTYGGSVSVASQVGVGSTFTVRLKRSLPGAAPSRHRGFFVPTV